LSKSVSGILKQKPIHYSKQETPLNDEDAYDEDDVMDDNESMFVEYLIGDETVEGAEKEVGIGTDCEVSLEVVLKNQMLMTWP
jgi:hypothetical protein